MLLYAYHTMRFCFVNAKKLKNGKERGVSPRPPAVFAGGRPPKPAGNVDFQPFLWHNTALVSAQRIPYSGRFTQLGIWDGQRKRVCTQWVLARRAKRTGVGRFYRAQRPAGSWATIKPSGQWRKDCSRNLSLLKKHHFLCRLRDGTGITYVRVRSTRSTLGFAKLALFKQAGIPLPNKVCQRSEIASAIFMFPGGMSWRNSPVIHRSAIHTVLILKSFGCAATAPQFLIPHSSFLIPK